MTPTAAPTVIDTVEALHERRWSCVELTEKMLSRAGHLQSSLNTFISLTEETALTQARAIDADLAAGRKLPPLAGVPQATKDVLATAGILTTAASKTLAGYVPPYTATAVEKINQAGAVMIGKANCDEFAMGASGENSAYGPTRNPWSLDHVPGGSSSGSAAAVASGVCSFALGTDTAGSVRVPAAFCNLVGLKPTYGRVSRHGLIALASSFDQVGIMTRTVTDCAVVLKSIAGHDPLDSTSADVPVDDYSARLNQPLPKLKIGLPKEYFAVGLDPEVDRVVHTAVKQLESLGCEVKEISLPHSTDALAVYYIIQPAEASSNLARYDGIRFGHRSSRARSLKEVYLDSRELGFGPEVKRRIMLGTFVLSAGYYDAYYVMAQKVRTLIINDHMNAFEDVDCIVSPTTPTPAFKLGERFADPLTMYLADLLTVAANLAGLPSLTVPAGFVRGLPIGLQITGPQFKEGRILQLANAYQQATDWHNRTAPELAL
jgi:aspartyl-tRNA(Asn)/glutamyl-tRNA(Gln) amidotransferase subunit A